MADSFLQQLQKNIGGATAPQNLTAPLGAQQDASAINRAAAGKASPTSGGSGPSRSNQQAEGLVDQVQQGAEAIQRDAQIGQLAISQQAEAQAKQAAFQDKMLSEQELNQREKFLATQEQILGDYTKGVRTLDLEKDKSRLEQLGFGMRLGSDKYISQLQQEAHKARLGDALRFDEEMKRAVFADEEELLRNDLQFRALMNARGRDLQDQLATIDIDTAIALAMADNKAANQRNMWEGIGQAVSAGAGFLGKYKPSGTTLEGTSTVDTQTASSDFGIDMTSGGVNS